MLDWFKCTSIPSIGLNPVLVQILIQYVKIEISLALEESVSTNKKLFLSMCFGIIKNSIYFLSNEDDMNRGRCWESFPSEILISINQAFLDIFKCILNWVEHCEQVRNSFQYENVNLT
jgi:hypothetical protein